MTIQRYPYAQVPAEVARHVRELGGRPLNLYRVLANAPPMLKIWVDFAYAVRRECKTPRSLRELMILRTAQLSESFYEWHQHRRMAREAGVPEQQVTELTMWRWSDAFDSRERAALAFTEAMVAGTVNDATHAESAGSLWARCCAPQRTSDRPKSLPAGLQGSMRAESAVDPTRSENITVTRRRSARSSGCGLRALDAVAASHRRDMSNPCQVKYVD